MKINLISAILGTIAVAGTAFASPIIVNLDATSAPGSSITETLAAGTYSVSVIGTTTQSALYNGWNTSNGAATNNLWTDRYGIDLCGGTCNEVVVMDGNPGYANALSALTAYDSATTVDLYNPTSGATVTGYSNPFKFTLNSIQNVIFSIPDYGSNSDDSGGESLQIAQVAATPEPGTFGLLGIAGLVAGFGLRRRFAGASV